MIEQPVLALGPHDDNAHAHAIHDHVARVRRIEPGQEAVARALRIEAAEALQALAHRGDAQRDKVVGIGRGGRLERDPGHASQACFQPSVSPARKGLSDASPNGTLAGSS